MACLPAVVACGGGSSTDAGSPDGPQADASPSHFQLVVDNHGGGVVSSEPAAIYCGSTCQQTFETGTIVSLQAAPGSLFEFAGWQGSCTGTGSCAVSLDQDQCVAASFSPPHHVWSWRYGAGRGFKPMAALAVDATGNIFVIGEFDGTMSAGGEVLESAGIEGNPDVHSDVFVAKYSPTGAHLWSRSFGGTSMDSASDLALDSTGQVVIAGTFEDEISLGGDLLTADGVSDWGGLFLAKLDSDGNHVWSLCPKGNGVERPDAIAIDGNDDVLLAGMFGSEIDFGEQVLVSEGGWDAFVAKYTGDGEFLWAKSYGSGPHDQVGKAITADSLNNIIVAGYFEDHMTLGGEELVSSGEWDGFLAKFTPDGDHLWSLQFGSVGWDDVTQVVVRTGDSVLISGWLSGTADLGGGELSAIGNRDMFVAEYSAGGEHLWSRRFGGTASTASAEDMTLDQAGNILIAGWFSGIAVEVGSESLATLGSIDALLVKLTPTGDPIWARRYGRFDRDGGMTIAIQGTDLLFGGQTESGPIDLGGGELPQIGKRDFFLARMTP